MNAILPIKPDESQEDSWTFDWRRRQKLRDMVTRDNRDSIKEVPELGLAAE